MAEVQERVRDVPPASNQVDTAGAPADSNENAIVARMAQGTAAQATLDRDFGTPQITGDSSAGAAGGRIVSNPGDEASGSDGSGSGASDKLVTRAKDTPQIVDGVDDLQRGAFDATPGATPGADASRKVIAESTDALKSLYDVDGKRFNLEKAREVFAKATDDWRKNNPDGLAGKFAEQFNAELMKKIPPTNRYFGNVNHLYATGASAGNLNLYEVSFQRTDNGAIRTIDLVAQSNIGNPFSNTNTANNANSLNSPEAVGRLAAGRLDVNQKNAGTTFLTAFEQMMKNNPSASPDKFVKTFNENSNKFFSHLSNGKIMMQRNDGALMANTPIEWSPRWREMLR